MISFCVCSFASFLVFFMPYAYIDSVWRILFCGSQLHKRDSAKEFHSVHCLYPALMIKRIIDANKKIPRREKHQGMYPRRCNILLLPLCLGFVNMVNFVPVLRAQRKGFGWEKWRYKSLTMMMMMVLLLLPLKPWSYFLSVEWGNKITTRTEEVCVRRWGEAKG